MEKQDDVDYGGPKPGAVMGRLVLSNEERKKEKGGQKEDGAGEVGGVVVVVGFMVVLYLLLLRVCLAVGSRCSRSSSR